MKVLRVDPALQSCIVKLLEVTFNGREVPLHRKKFLQVNGILCRPGQKGYTSAPLCLWAPWAFPACQLWNSPWPLAAMSCAMERGSMVPLWNNQKEYQVEMLDSVMNQTYGNWELCLADGSDQDHAYLGDI